MSKPGPGSWEVPLAATLTKLGVYDAGGTVQRWKKVRAERVAAERTVREVKKRLLAKESGARVDAADRQASRDSETASHQVVLSRLSDLRDRLVETEARMLRARERDEGETTVSALRDRLAKLEGIQARGVTPEQFLAYAAAIAVVSVVVALTIGKFVG